MCCEATITKRVVAWVGSVQPECTVPLSAWSFRNFKPEFLLNGKRPWSRMTSRTKPKWSVPFDEPTEISGLLGGIETALHFLLFLCIYRSTTTTPKCTLRSVLFNLTSPHPCYQKAIFGLHVITCSRYERPGSNAEKRCMGIILEKHVLISRTCWKRFLHAFISFSHSE